MDFPVVIVIALSAGGFYWQYWRSHSLLRGWAQENDFELMHSEMRFFQRGAFFWASSKGQTVFYVTVRDRQGQVRSGWVRCGGWWLGLFSHKTEVRWQE
jgi:hypothetical protein